VLVFGDKVAGYANYGRNRARSLHFEGEIYELYLRPEFQGLGFGRRLFTSARRDLLQSGLKSMVIWALSDNDTATEFYRASVAAWSRARRRNSGPSRSTRSPSPGLIEFADLRARATPSWTELPSADLKPDLKATRSIMRIEAISID